MSGQIDDGGPVHPGQWVDFQPTTGDQVVREQWSGMSLRDWFAGQERIEQEEIAWEVCESLAGPRPSGDYRANALEWFNWANKWQASVRYARADAMIAARKGGSR